MPSKLGSIYHCTFFFYSLLKDYKVALGQLLGFSWWIVMAYFIDCCQRNEDLITMRNLFRYYLEGFNPNGWRRSDNREVTQSIDAQPKSIDHIFGNNWSETDSTFHEINEALISGAPPSVPLISLPIPVDVDSPPVVPYVAPTLAANEEATFECNSDFSPWCGHVSSLEYPYDPTHNEDLLEHLMVAEVKADTLSYEIDVEREDKEATQAELDRVTAEHIV
ncbi:hypothetical protein GOBAR_AA34459 [Gossypium barbadense]|uniref:Uncharacterized protein n=1 Tax=Gossypium barbadense TaxID=3634 RepID=A0A2P5W548_GOSBA|nr:hypothetical protein GOBAR_AA34459 [Gossypium barbadense]